MTDCCQYMHWLKVKNLANSPPENKTFDWMAHILCLKDFIILQARSNHNKFNPQFNKRHKRSNWVLNIYRLISYNIAAYVRHFLYSRLQNCDVLGSLIAWGLGDLLSVHCSCRSTAVFVVDFCRVFDFSTFTYITFYALH